MAECRVVGSGVGLCRLAVAGGHGRSTRSGASCVLPPADPPTLRVKDVEDNAATQAFRDQAASLLALLAFELADDGTVGGTQVAATVRQFALTARDFAATIRTDNAPDRPDQVQAPESVTPGPPDLPDQAQVPEDAIQGSQ